MANGSNPPYHMSMKMPRVLVAALAVGALADGWGCSSSKGSLGPGGGGNGVSAGTGGANGSGGIVGTAGSSGPAGQSGVAGSSGGAGTTGSAGTSGTGAGGAAADMVACDGLSVSNGVPGAIANSLDFSLDADTGARDRHTLWMGRADMVRRVLGYSTGGSADHKHNVQFTDDQLNMLLGGGSVSVTTLGPSNATTGHTHTVTVTSCGVTQGFGGTGGG